MKKLIALTFILYIFAIPFYRINAVTEMNDLQWGSGTSIRFTGEIASEKLTDDFHTLRITVTLLSLNESAVELYNIRVDYRIEGHFSQYRPLSRLSSINSSSSVDVLFQYDSLWENCTLDMKISFDENNTLTSDPTYFTDWIVFFNLEPYVEPTETPTYTNPTSPTSTPTNSGFDWGKNWYIFPVIAGGILIVLLLAKLGTTLKYRRKQRLLK